MSINVTFPEVLGLKLVNVLPLTFVCKFAISSYIKIKDPDGETALCPQA